MKKPKKHPHVSTRVVRKTRRKPGKIPFYWVLPLCFGLSLLSFGCENKPSIEKKSKALRSEKKTEREERRKKRTKGFLHRQKRREKRKKHRKQVLGRLDSLNELFKQKHKRLKKAHRKHKQKRAGNRP